MSVSVDAVNWGYRNVNTRHVRSNGLRSYQCDIKDGPHAKHADQGVVFKRNNGHVPRCDTSIDRPYDETFDKIVGTLYAVPRPPK